MEHPWCQTTRTTIADRSYASAITGRFGIYWWKVSTTVDHPRLSTPQQAPCPIRVTQARLKYFPGMDHADDSSSSGRFAIGAGVLLLIVALAMLLVAMLEPSHSHRTILELGIGFLVFGVGYVVWGLVALAKTGRAVDHDHDGDRR
jgi:hypothetical protein